MNKTGKGIQCPKCKDKIYSDYTHDFKYCSCQTCFVDGGYDYLRYGYDGKIPKVVCRPRLSKKKKSLGLSSARKTR